MDRGGAQDELPAIPPAEPIPAEVGEDSDDDDDDEEEIDHALSAKLDKALKANLARSHARVLDQIDPTKCLSWDEAYAIAWDIYQEKAFSAAVRPEDSPRSWRDAMSQPDADKCWKLLRSSYELCLITTPGNLSYSLTDGKPLAPAGSF